MRITPAPIHLSVKRSATITDGPILPMSTSTTGKKFRLERITVTYTWNGSAWKANGSYSVDLGGTILKKDGTDSLNDHSGRLYGNRPVWLTEIVARLRPHGTPLFNTDAFDIPQGG